MALRPFVTAGVSFAAAGAVAATVALAPPLTPRDIQVAKSTEVSLAAVVTDPYFQSLINTYFDSGAAGVAQQLLVQLAGTDTAGVDLVNGYFNSGIFEVLRQYLVNASPGDTPTDAYINTFFIPVADDSGDGQNFGQFGLSGVVYKRLMEGDLTPEQRMFLATLFNGGQLQYDEDGNLITEGGVPVLNTVGYSNPALFGASGLVYQRLLGGDLTPEQRKFVADFFNGGATLVVKNRLLASTSDPEQQQFINDFFDGGASLVAYRRSGGDVGTLNNPADPNSGIAPTSTPYLSAFYGINNNRLDPDNTGNPGLFGVSGVVYQRLTEGLPEGSTDRDLVDEFFNNGITGVVRYILTGPLPPDPAPVAPPSDVPEENVQLLRASAVSAPEEATEAPEVTAPKTVSADLGKAAKAPAVVPVAAAAPAPEPAAAPEPVAAPEPKVEPTSKVKEAEPESAADKMKTGGNFSTKPGDPILIVGDGSPKPGEGRWGIFSDIADAIAGKTPPAAGAAEPGGAADAGGAG